MEKDEVLDLAERNGYENLKGHLATGDVLHAHANGLLGLLLAGVAGALAMARVVFDAAPAPAHAWGAAAVCAWWALVAVVLVYGCILTRQTEVLYNEPGNLYRPEAGWSLMKLRRADLQYLQQRIDRTKRRNSQVAWWLDRCRIAALMAPAWFTIAALAAGSCCRG